MYYDSAAVPTICYGQNLNNDYAKSAIEAVGGSYENVMAGGCLSETQCTSLMMKDVYHARQSVKNIYGDSVSCPCAENVLVDMTYNLGEAGLAEFTSFNALIIEGNWDAAGDDLLTGTLWCR